MVDTWLGKITSRKLMVWTAATILMACSIIESADWVMISALYIGGQSVIDAIAKMLNDKDSMKIINKKVGKYPTLTGAEAQAHVDMLFSLINEDTLRNLLKVTQFTIGTEGVFKPELLQ